MTAKKTTHSATPDDAISDDAISDDTTAQPDRDVAEGVHKMSDPIEATDSAPNASDEDTPDQDMFDNVPV